MTSEKIIANIERYVNGLSNEERQMYENALTHTEAENRELKEIFSIIGLAEIVQTLKREMREKALKEANGGSYVKRSKLIAKLLDKMNDSRQELKKAWYEEINGEKMQCCLVGGFYGYAFKNPLDLPITEEAENPFTLQRVIPDYSGFEKLDITKSLAEFKTELKLHKAKKDRTPCYIEVNEKWYSTEYLINVIEGLGGNVVMYQNPNKLYLDIFESENGLAVLMPARPPKTK